MLDDQLYAAGLEDHPDTRHQQPLRPDVCDYSAGLRLLADFGIMKTEWPIIITNGVCLLLSAFILVMTILPRAKKDAVADALNPAGGTDRSNSKA